MLHDPLSLQLLSPAAAAAAATPLSLLLEVGTSAHPATIVVVQEQQQQQLLSDRSVWPGQAGVRRPTLNPKALRGWTAFLFRNRCPVFYSHFRNEGKRVCKANSDYGTAG
ncbi:hypothetical protein AXG93_2619s1030 [Marchantia polymorpha subsp. ruderalis]|uniref:Uncharacterized protein n=1 Tax=Marchantia polymorpha subsp. ruderalis TaxID=1480154 RepID=A0A176VNT7_MARPO|nr:hypothetical protein AXG93_2619s1030 [Marchantia polymorpha subsp. ruderalis]